jgi:predicted nucleic acid-binding protein
MMLLDTNIVSAFLKGQPPKLFAFVSDHLATEGLAVSYVTQFELRRGIEKLVRKGSRGDQL